MSRDPLNLSFRTLMGDISLCADICSEAVASVVKIHNAHLNRLTSERHPRALHQQPDDATCNTGCQFQYVVDHNGIVDYFLLMSSQLNEEVRDEAT